MRLRNKKPLYQHDCDVCQYVMTIRDADGKDLDMYIHVRQTGPRIDLNYVVRASGIPEDYTSWTRYNHPTSSLPSSEPGFEPMADWEIELLNSGPFYEGHLADSDS